MSCGPEISSRDELIQFVHHKDNGLKKEVDNGENLELVMTYMPYQLFLDRVKSEDRDNLYFSLQISYNNKPLSRQVPRAMYSELVQLFSFDFQNYVTYSYGVQTTNVKYVSYNQHDQRPSYDNLVIIVPRDAAFEGGKELCVTVQEFGFQSGASSFTFRTKDIKRIDGLNID